MARRIARATFGRLWVLSSRLERLSRAATVATYEEAELDQEREREWERFGREPVASDALFDWEKPWFDEHVQPGGRLLVVGAGTGRDVLPFVAAGHEVVALDIAPEALATLAARAEARGLRVTTLLTPVEAASLAPESFDAVIFSWLTYGLIRGSERRIEALRIGARSLRDGGRILVSYPRGTGVGGRIARFVRPLARAFSTRPIEASDSFMLSNAASGLSLYHSTLLSPGDMEREAAAAGLSIRAHETVHSALGLAVLARPARGSGPG